MDTTQTNVEPTKASGAPSASSIGAGASGDDSRKHTGLVFLVVLVVLAIVIGGVVFTGIRSRREAEAKLVRATEQAAIPIVEVIHPKAGDPTMDLVLPGNLVPYAESPIYSRATGYIREWYVDIGARVERGQLLAEIETPELDQQLEQARADLEVTRANLETATITADRWRRLLESDSVSAQETDQFVGNERALQATLESNAANVRRLEQLVAYQRIYAPFDGVITARNANPGVLVDANANAPGKELFDLAAIHILRLYVAIPGVYAQSAQLGSITTIRLDAYPGEVFHAEIARNAYSIDRSSRTLLTEIDIENADERLMPGAYAVVHLSLPNPAPSVSIPSNTLIFQKAGAQVAVVRDERVQLVPITIGRDYGSTLEVVKGLSAADQVIANPSDSLMNGMRVRIKGPTGASPGEKTTQ